MAAETELFEPTNKDGSQSTTYNLILKLHRTNNVAVEKQ
jgi:hypothetical protein